MDAKIFRVNYKSDFILTLTSDAGWMTPFCIKFWTGSPMLAYYASYDGETYTHCTYDPSEPTKLTVQFDDHHLPIGDLKYQVAYHFTVADFPENTEDEVTNQANVTTVIDGDTYQVMLDLNGETAPEIQFALPAYANELQRIQNEQTRIAHEQQRVNQEAARVTEFNGIKAEALADHQRANEDHTRALSDSSNAASDRSRANSDHSRAESDHSTASSDHLQASSDHSRAQSDHNTALSDHQTALSDHTQANTDHTRADSDHTRATADSSTAAADHRTASTDHTQANTDHTRAESDHQRVESDLAEVEEFSNSLGAYDISAAHATGSTLATYPDLATALGTNGSNIPEALRKGGMSVKFVLTYDNNSTRYVQYRLMSTFWSTTESDWQGVGDEPTAGSDDLANSGGVRKAIDKEIGNLIYGKAINADGNEVEDEDYLITKPIAVKSSDTVYYKCGYATDYRLVVYSADGSKVWDYTGTSYVRTIDHIPAGVAYMKATFRKGTEYSLVVDDESLVYSGVEGEIRDIQKDISDIDSDIAGIHNDITGINGDITGLQSDISRIDFDVVAVDNKAHVSVYGNLIDGKAINLNGEEVEDADWIASDKIPAKSGQVVVYRAGVTSTHPTYSLVAYKGDNTRIDNWRDSGSGRTITLPANTSYIRASFKKGTNYSLTYDGSGESLIGDGVYSAVSELDSDVTAVDAKVDYAADRVDRSYDMISGVAGNVIKDIMLNNVGKEIASAGWNTTVFIPVQPNDSVKYFSGKTGSCLLFYGSDKKTVIADYSSTAYERTITAPAGAAFLRASLWSAAAVQYLRINDVNALEASVTLDVDKCMDAYDYYNKLSGNYLAGSAVNQSTGAVVTQSDCIATKEIKVNPGDAIVYNSGTHISSQGYGLACYRYDGSRCNGYGGNGTDRSVTLSGDVYFIRATFKGTNYKLTINGVAWTKDEGIINEQEDAIEDNINKKHLLPLNIFGDVLPPMFKSKLLAMENDLLVAVQGDSIAGLVEYCDVQEAPEHCPPGCQYKSWLYLLQNRVSKVKPVYDRVDSQRDGADVFTKTGTWQDVVTAGRTDVYANDGTYGQQRSLSAFTFLSGDSDAALSFEFDADTYEKCNIVFSKEPDGVLTKIVVTEGDDKMLVSEDRTTWVEANGYQYSQRTAANYSSADGNASREPHRRLWMKRASGVTGTLHISYQRDNSTSYENSYMYVWGIEKYSGVAIFFDNLGRGGRSTNYQRLNISDIFDRHPDLAVYEMPLANEVGHSSGAQTRATLKGDNYYGQYFFGSDNPDRGDCFKYRSNDYTTMPLIIILPHGRSGYFDNDNCAIRWSTAPEGEPDAYTCYKQMYGWLQDGLKSYENVKFINVYDQLINEALVIDPLIKNGFYKETGGGNQITYDSIHLNQYGAYLWLKYLAGIFQI